MKVTLKLLLVACLFVVSTSLAAAGELCESAQAEEEGPIPEVDGVLVVENINATKDPKTGRYRFSTDLLLTFRSATGAMPQEVDIKTLMLLALDWKNEAVGSLFVEGSRDAQGNFDPQKAHATLHPHGYLRLSFKGYEPNQQLEDQPFVLRLEGTVCNGAVPFSAEQNAEPVIDPQGAILESPEFFALPRSSLGEWDGKPRPFAGEDERAIEREAENNGPFVASDGDVIGGRIVATRVEIPAGATVTVTESLDILSLGAVILQGTFVWTESQSPAEPTFDGTTVQGPDGPDGLSLRIRTPGTVFLGSGVFQILNGQDALRIDDAVVGQILANSGSDPITRSSVKPLPSGGGYKEVATSAGQFLLLAEPA